MVDNHGAEDSAPPADVTTGSEFGTLADLLRTRAQADAAATAYEFLNPDQTVESITYGELGERVAETAAVLAHRAAARPALILHPPGLDYIVALWACLTAGIPAVPAYPPAARTADRSLERLGRLVADSGAATILAPDEVVAALPESLGAGLATVGGAPAGGHADDSPDPEGVAIIQYTSGSTGTPNGVVLTHRNLLHNLRAITHVFRLDRTSRGFVWLPPYHDMGLIGGILTPMYVGFPMRLMAPLHFLKSPLTWLTQIGDTRATVSGGPNFSYELLLRKCADAAADLDLSSWRVAFNGAEPVRHLTMTEFSRHFAPAGFRPAAFLPCYGLAEATLIVTGAHWRPAGDPARVSCGPPIPGHRVAIVDAAGRPVPDGAEGEIWVRGPSVSPGYWTGPGRPPSGESMSELDGVRHLRTGDIGMLRDGELHVCGRLKDVLIRHGRNYHASDIEDAACGGASRSHVIAAAFDVDGPDLEPHSVLVVGHRAGGGADGAAADIRSRVLERTGLSLDVVAVLPQRLVPRTSSGKVQRSRCRTRYLAGEYDKWCDTPARKPPGPSTTTVGLSAFLTGVFGAVCEVDCDEHTSLLTIGGDSLKAAEIAAIVEEAIGLAVPVDAVLTATTPRTLAERLLDDWRAQGAEHELVVGRLTAAGGGVGP